jgi:hypothetical protein
LFYGYLVPPAFQYAGYPVAFGGGALAGGLLGLAWPGLAVYRGTIVAKDWNNTLNEIRNTPPSLPFEAPITTSVDYVTNGIKIASQVRINDIYFLNQSRITVSNEVS